MPSSWFVPLVFTSSSLLTLAGAAFVGIVEAPVLPLAGLGTVLGGLALTSTH